jgi:mannosyltransferase
VGCDAVICVSENTKRDFIRFYPGFNKPIYIVYNGVDFQQLGDNSNFDCFDLGFNYFLYVGNRSGCKNFKFLIDAFGDSNFLQENVLKVMCVGGGEFTQHEKYLIRNARLEELFIHLPSVNNDQLGFLYRKAKALLMPSEYEGFGIPAVEALSQKCPVIDSGTSALPEVIPYSVFRYKHNNVNDFLSTCDLVLTNDKIRGEAAIKGYEFSKKFSWDANAVLTLNVYSEILGVVRD